MVTHDSDDVSSLYHRGVAYSKMSNMNEAIEDFTKVRRGDIVHRA